MRYFLGVLFVVSLISIAKSAFSLIQYDTSAVGVVVNVDASHMGNTGWATISYADSSDRSWSLLELHSVVESRAGKSTFYRPPRVGERVEVRYIKSSPNIAKIKSEWVAECVVTFLVAILLPVLTLSIWPLVKSKQM